eukprot:10339228-Lingulodinium_polyedra.AAC.1
MPSSAGLGRQSATAQPPVLHARRAGGNACQRGTKTGKHPPATPCEPMPAKVHTHNTSRES